LVGPSTAVTPRARWPCVELEEKDRLILDFLIIRSAKNSEHGGNKSRPNR
jgi:hypothetical protein